MMTEGVAQCSQRTCKEQYLKRRERGGIWLDMTCPPFVSGSASKHLDLVFNTTFRIPYIV